MRPPADVLIDGGRRQQLPPAKRGIAMVFQTYALYPHLTVKNNMGARPQAGRHAGGRDRAGASASPRRCCRSNPISKRRPAELSGGQRQRVAIGRALVREPKLFLFDEPLSNLDAALRVNTRLEIAQLHRALKATMIYVTHDQVEAMTLADKIVVLNAGRIEQIGAPMELYNSPANEFVAGFIGSPKMNFVEGERLGDTRQDGRRPAGAYFGRAKGRRLEGHGRSTPSISAPTPTSISTTEKAGLITVRIFGVYDAEPGATLFATPDPLRTYRFDAEGRTMG